MASRRKNCKHCKTRMPAIPKKLIVRRAVYEADPYCSAKCCRAAHGVQWLSGSSAVYPEDGFGEAA